MITIDGSHGEGGGQMVRTALALSALTGKAFEVTNIRAKRCDPGLKAQHLHCIKAVQELCSAKTSTLEVGSNHLRFIPGALKGKTISIDIGTAGSIALVLQAALLPALFAGKSRLRLTGGTDGKWAMPMDYCTHVLCPQLQKYADIKVVMERRGYFPEGNGKVDVRIKSKYRKEKDFDAFWKQLRQAGHQLRLAEQQQLLSIKGISHASQSLEQAQVAERQAGAARIALAKCQAPISIRAEYSNTSSDGSGIVLWALYGKDEIDTVNPIILGADALGERGKRAEAVGEEAAKNLLEEMASGAAVDSHLEDNLIPFLALFGGAIRVPELTEHTRTNIMVTEQFLPVKFRLDEEKKIILCSLI
ncbi:RNA 3'-terminal phosphate cyclase [Candidatus Woesearchaeota archaeon]|nr:RNA 3'-terminal phosphate cyclase [Candidatus Woesearchaeota archaeon]